MSTRLKYPRTPHLPWSPGASADDVLLGDTSRFEGREVVVTEKMDGENTTLYADYVHARSLDSAHHPSRSWVKALQAQLRDGIPMGWRLCGENLYAEHSLRYATLPSYFMLFSIWDESNHALSWDDTAQWADLLGLVTVPVLYRGPWDEKRIRALTETLDPRSQEGIVVRPAERFAFGDFTACVAKWVRPNHVTTDVHWMSRPVRPNGLKETP
jgi:hypothetical protein